MVIKPLSAILYQVEVVMRVITADDQLLELVPGDRSVIERSLHYLCTQLSANCVWLVPLA